MMKFWTGLSQRERLLIAAGGALFAVFFVFQFVFSPFSNWRKTASLDAQYAETQYKLVLEASALGGAFVKAEDIDLETPLRDVLTQTASPNSISLNFVNSRADGQIDASTVSTAPDNLFTWLAVLEQKYGVSVVSADIAREQGETGTVRAQLTFSR